MVYQLLDRVIRYVLTWVLTAFVGSLFPPPAPKLVWSCSHLQVKSYNRP
jgi:hypothetical protein